MSRRDLSGLRKGSNMSNNIKECAITYKDSQTGETLYGVFKFKIVLSMRDILAQDQHYRNLIGNTNGTAPGPDASAIASIFSKLWAHLTESPSWWKERGNGIDIPE